MIEDDIYDTKEDSLEDLMCMLLYVVTSKNRYNWDSQILHNYQRY